MQEKYNGWRRRKKTHTERRGDRISRKAVSQFSGNLLTLLLHGSLMWCSIAIANLTGADWSLIWRDDGPILFCLADILGGAEYLQEIIPAFYTESLIGMWIKVLSAKGLYPLLMSYLKIWPKYLTIKDEYLSSCHFFFPTVMPSGSFYQEKTWHPHSTRMASSSQNILFSLCQKQGNHWFHSVST